MSSQTWAIIGFVCAVISVVGKIVMMIINITEDEDKKQEVK